MQGDENCDMNRLARPAVQCGRRLKLYTRISECIIFLGRAVHKRIYILILIPPIIHDQQSLNLQLVIMKTFLE